MDLKALVPTLLLGYSSLAQLTSDIRIVAGKEVDLNPLREWAQDRKGERPLKHWKQLNVTAFIAPLANWSKIAVRSEAGMASTILAANFSPEFRRHFEELSRLSGDIQRLQTYVNKADARVRYADASTPKAAVGEITWVEDIMNERYAVERAKVTLDLVKSKLDDMRRQQSTLASTKIADFAMFTGQKYAGLEVWDFGRKK